MADLILLKGFNILIFVVNKKWCQFEFSECRPEADEIDHRYPNLNKGLFDVLSKIL